MQSYFIEEPKKFNDDELLNLNGQLHDSFILYSESRHKVDNIDSDKKKTINDQLNRTKHSYYNQNINTQHLYNAKFLSQLFSQMSFVNRLGNYQEYVENSISLKTLRTRNLQESYQFLKNEVQSVKCLLQSIQDQSYFQIHENSSLQQIFQKIFDASVNLGDSLDDFQSNFQIQKQNKKRKQIKDNSQNHEQIKSLRELEIVDLNKNLRVLLNHRSWMHQLKLKAKIILKIVSIISQKIYINYEEMSIVEFDKLKESIISEVPIYIKTDLEQMKEQCKENSLLLKLNPSDIEIDNGALLLFNIKEIFMESFDQKLYPYLNFNEFQANCDSNYKLVKKLKLTNDNSMNRDVEQRQKIVLKSYLNSNLISWFDGLAVSTSELFIKRVEALSNENIFKQNNVELYQFFYQYNILLCAIDSRQNLSKIFSYLNFFESLVQKVSYLDKQIDDYLIERNNIVRPETKPCFNINKIQFFRYQVDQQSNIHVFQSDNNDFQKLIFEDAFIQQNEYLEEISNICGYHIEMIKEKNVRLEKQRDIQKKQKLQEEEGMNKNDENKKDEYKPNIIDVELLTQKIIQYEIEYNFEKSKILLKLIEILKCLYKPKHIKNCQTKILSVIKMRPRFDLFTDTLFETYQMEIKLLKYKIELIDGMVLDQKNQENFVVDQYLMFINELNLYQNDNLNDDAKQRKKSRTQFVKIPKDNINPDENDQQKLNELYYCEEEKILYKGLQSTQPTRNYLYLEGIIDVLECITQQELMLERKIQVKTQLNQIQFEILIIKEVLSKWEEYGVKKFYNKIEGIRDYQQYFENFTLKTPCPFKSFICDVQQSVSKNNNFQQLKLSWELDSIYLVIRALEFMKFEQKLQINLCANSICLETFNNNQLKFAQKDSQIDQKYFMDIKNIKSDLGIFSTCDCVLKIKKLDEYIAFLRYQMSLNNYAEGAITLNNLYLSRIRSELDFNKFYNLQNIQLPNFSKIPHKYFKNIIEFKFTLSQKIRDFALKLRLTNPEEEIDNSLLLSKMSDELSTESYIDMSKIMVINLRDKLEFLSAIIPQYDIFKCKLIKQKIIQRPVSSVTQFTSKETMDTMTNDLDNSIQSGSEIQQTQDFEAFFDSNGNITQLFVLPSINDILDIQLDIPSKQIYRGDYTQIYIYFKNLSIKIDGLKQVFVLEQQLFIFQHKEFSQQYNIIFPVFLNIIYPWPFHVFFLCYSYHNC